jgi:hypothetical protein
MQPKPYGGKMVLIGCCGNRIWKELCEGDGGPHVLLYCDMSTGICSQNFKDDRHDKILTKAKKRSLQVDITISTNNSKITMIKI